MSCFTKKRVEHFRSRVDADNIASQALMDSLKAIPNGISNLFLHSEEHKRQIEREYSHLLDDRLIKLAGRFGVEPKKLLSHALEYKIVPVKSD